MLKWISPIITRFKMLPSPRLFAVPGHAGATNGQPTFGQKLAERVAAFVGSWAFLSAQAGFLVLWLIYNTLQITRHFDPPPYILLNLLLSFQAAFTGPVLLIAANVGAIRDHAQSDRIERLSFESEKLAAQNRELVERLLSIEQLLEEHIGQSLQAHTEELRELGAVIRDVHAVVCGTPAKAASPASGSAAVAVAIPTAPAIPAGPATGDDGPDRAPEPASIAEAQPATSTAASPAASRPRTRRGQARGKG
jgi:uncharacterized membrane protein